MEETPKSEERYFHYENIGKSVVTTVIGIFMMAASGGTFMASWFIELPLIKGWDKTLGILAVFTIGLFLLFAKDKLITNIDLFWKKKVE